MATVDIIELIKPETGEKFYPYAHINGVKGAELLPRIGSPIQTTLSTAIYQLHDALGAQFYPQTHAEAVVGLAQAIADSQFFEERVDPQDSTKKYIWLKDKYTGVGALGWIAAGGVGQGGGGGGGGGSYVSWGAEQGSVVPLTVEGTTKRLLMDGALSGYALSSSIPTALSQLSADSTHRLVTDSQISNWNSKTSFSGNYNDLTNKPTIPTDDTVEAWGFTKNQGTVKSVTLTQGTGITVSNSGEAITETGERTISISQTYRSYISHGETAYGWGNHASAGYLTQSSLSGYATQDWVQGRGYLTSESDPTVPPWAKAANKPSYAFSELTSHPTTISGYGITDAKFGTPGTDNVPITLGSTTKSVLTDHQDLTPLTNRLSAIEDWFEVVNVGTAESPNYALHAKQGRAIYSDSWIAAGGVGSGSSSSGGLITRVRSITDLGTSIATESLTETFSAKAIEGIYEEVRNLTGSGLATQTWVNNQGFLKTETDPTVPAWAKASSKPSYSFSEILNKPTTLAGYGITDGFKKTGGDISGDIYHEIEEEDAESGEVVVHEFWRISENGEAHFDTLDVDGVSVQPRNYVTKANAQTITGVKTFSGGITMSGANIITSADSTNNIGASGSRFLAGHIRNLYTTYFAFMSDDGQTQRGNIGMGSGYASIHLIGTPTVSYNFFADAGFFHSGDGAAPCGRSDHRWSKVWTEDADISGSLVIGGDIVPAADLGSQLGYSSRRFATGSIVNIHTRSVIFKHQTTEKKDGLIAGGDGYFRFRTGADIDTAYKDIVFHETYGFYPDQSGVNLGYGSAAQYRWATIYGVNADLTGDLALASSSHIDIGPLRIEYDATNKALHITKKDSTDTETYGIYADGFVAAGGVGQTS